MQGKFICLTPIDQCTGAKLGQASAHLYLDKAVKVHTTGQEANDCYGVHLVNQGYTKVNSREFTKEGEPTVTLAKASRQADLRPGKKYAGDRLMPRHNSGGVIVG